MPGEGERVDACAQRAVANTSMTSGTANAMSEMCRPKRGSRKGSETRQANTAVVSVRRWIGAAVSRRVGAMRRNALPVSARSVQPQRSQRGESIVADAASRLQPQ